MLMTRDMALKAVNHASTLVKMSKLIKQRSALSAIRALDLTGKNWVKPETRGQEMAFSLHNALVALELAVFVATFVYQVPRFADVLAEIMYRLKFDVAWDEAQPVI